VSLLLGIPAGYLAVGLGISAITHVVFGAIGGWLGSFVVRSLSRLRVPAIEALRAERENGV
jgi:glycopeptide antibiotics resistance protein